MGANDSKRKNTRTRDRIRTKILWFAALLVVLTIVRLVFPRAHSNTPVAPQPEAPASSTPSNTPSSETNVFPVKESPRFSQPQIEPETERLISLMLDKSLSQQFRRQAARSLAKIGTDEAMAALKAALDGDLPPYVKAAIAEGLGESPNPEASALLHKLVIGKDETVARAAARGLALQGDADAVDMLGKVLFSDQAALSVRTEAALALGDVNLESAKNLLTWATTQIQDEDVQESVLDGLARRPFSETEPFFENYLNSSKVPPSLKVLAIQALTDTDGEVGPFLSKYLSDSNPDVRAAAKSALDYLGQTPAPGK